MARSISDHVGTLHALRTESCSRDAWVGTRVWKVISLSLFSYPETQWKHETCAECCERSQPNCTNFLNHCTPLEGKVIPALILPETSLRNHRVNPDLIKPMAGSKLQLHHQWQSRGQAPELQRRMGIGV